ncbi:Uncharacterised protein [Chlamydia trachomatis]|nr:Uncharacterised protein [Chlamydia trachomatis]SYV91812.1 Uncharacterised protein [Mesomycoplasma hyorhinis]
MNIAHFVNFLKPLSLETLNKSRSLEPTSAPENEFECGDINNESIIIQSEISMIIPNNNSFNIFSLI